MCKIAGVRFCWESGSSFVCEYFFSPCIDFARPLSFRSWSGQEVGYAHILCKLPVTELLGHGIFDRLEDTIDRWSWFELFEAVDGVCAGLYIALKRSKNKPHKVYLDFDPGREAVLHKHKSQPVNLPYHTRWDQKEHSYKQASNQPCKYLLVYIWLTVSKM